MPASVPDAYTDWDDAVDDTTPAVTTADYSRGVTIDVIRRCT